MRPFTPFNPANTSSGTIITNGVNAGEQIVIYNDSLSALLIQFPDKTSDVLPPLWVRDWIITSVPMGNLPYTVPFTLSLINEPISLVYGTLYEPGEHVAHINSPMPRTIGIGNTQGLSVSNIETLTNDGSTAGTKIIEATASGSPLSNVVITNDGSVNFNVMSNGNYINIFSITPGNSTTPATLTLNNLSGNIVTTGEISSTLTSGTGLSIVAKSSLDNGSITTDGSGDITSSGTITVKEVIQNVASILGLSVTGSAKLDNGAITTDGLGDITTSGTITTKELIQNVANVLGLSVTGSAKLDNGAISTDGSGDVSTSGTITAKEIIQNVASVLGLSVVGSSSLDNGNITTDGSGNIILKGGKLGVATSGDLIDASATSSAAIYIKCVDSTGKIIFQIPNGTSVASLDHTGSLALNGGISGTTATIAGQITSTSGNIQSGGNFTYNDGSHLSRVHGVGGTGNGTFNHYCNTTPNVINLTCKTSSGGSQTMGTYNWTTTTFSVTTGAGLGWVGFASVF